MAPGPSDVKADRLSSEVLTSAAAAWINDEV
jgi:hypothetical protein